MRTILAIAATTFLAASAPALAQQQPAGDSTGHNGGLTGNATPGSGNSNMTGQNGPGSDGAMKGSMKGNMGEGRAAAPDSNNSMKSGQ